MSESDRRGFTLVELLVVIAVIGILVAILLPAVQAARESARRATCSNNVKQLANACLQHLEKFKHFPTGGWGQRWVGLPNRGSGERQPGGWIYNVLPYMDQTVLHDLGMPGTNAPNIPIGSARRVVTPLAVLHCPSRRRVAEYPAVAAHCRSPRETATSPPLTKVARTDYAINGGSVPAIDPRGGPNSLSDAARYAYWPNTSNCNGISYSRSRVLDTHVRDGLSNTYLLGEKYLDPQDYTTGLDSGDNGIAYSGDEDDTIRWARNDPNNDRMHWPPMMDREGSNNYSSSYYGRSMRFGSAHSAGCYMAFCDGSVHLIPFAIDAQTHEYLARRDDGAAIDATQFD